MAAILAASDERDAGLDFAQRAVAGNPDDADSHYALGTLLELHERLAEAERSYRMAVELSPTHARAHNNLGVLLQVQGRSEEAREAYLRAVEADPGLPEANQNYAALSGDAAALRRAVEGLGARLARRPNDAASWSRLGHALQSLGDVSGALNAYRRAVELAPSDAEAHFNLGVLLQVQGEISGAFEAFGRAVALDPASPEAAQNFATLQSDPQALERAVVGFRARLAREGDRAATWHSLGNAYRALGRHADSIDSYARAIALAPDHAEAHFHLGLALLRRGDYAKGWGEHEWRLRTALHGNPARRFQQPLWHGRETAHTVLLHAEQGLGDTMQFVRYALSAAPRCGSIVVECQPELKTLLEAMRAAPQIVARGDPLPPFAMHAPLMSLPAILGTTLDTVPWPGPYLGPPYTRVINWRRAVRKRRGAFNVGLAWAGRPTHWDDLNRSTTLSTLAPLGQVPAATFFSLQKGEASAQASAPPSGMQLHDLSSKLADFADTAALVAFMDLVITVDTSIAHLAGAMGKPTWVLLPYVPDWRYHLEREDNPWYPTMKLFRQERHGDWSAPVAKMAAELARLAQLKTAKAKT